MTWVKVSSLRAALAIVHGRAAGQVASCDGCAPRCVGEIEAMVEWILLGRRGSDVLSEAPVTRCAPESARLVRGFGWTELVRPAVVHCCDFDTNSVCVDVRKSGAGDGAGVLS